jgi:hypothetical protein
VTLFFPRSARCLGKNSTHPQREPTQRHRVSILSSEETSLGRPTLRCGAEVRWAAEGRHLSGISAFTQSYRANATKRAAITREQVRIRNQIRAFEKGGEFWDFRITTKGSFTLLVRRSFNSFLDSFARSFRARHETWSCRRRPLVSIGSAVIAYRYR